MSQLKQMKLENPTRVSELDPNKTLERIGIGPNDTICDIGAGSGIFTIPAAYLTQRVYALETDDEMLEIISEKAKKEGLTNIDLLKVQNDRLPLEGNAVDIVLLITVLHEIENKAIFLKEIKRVLKTNGRILVIEFHKRQTPVGPPVPHRIAGEVVKKAMGEAGILLLDEFNLGDNFYCLVFQLSKED